MKILNSLLLVGSVLLSMPSLASYTCSGKVRGLTISAKTGLVMAERIAGFTWPVLCNVSTPHGGVSPESCTHIFSLLLAAQASEKDVVFWFNDEDAGGNCDNKTPWSDLTGWYFGPKMEK